MVCFGSGTVVQICRLEADSLIVISEVVLSDYIYDLDLSANILYVANDDLGLSIIDISDAHNPAILGSYQAISQARKVHVQGDTAYVSSRSGTSMLDVREKSNPELIGTVNRSGYTFHQNILYGAKSSALNIYDITDPSSPIELATIDTLGFVKGVFYQDHYVYTVSSQKGLSIIDVNDPSNPLVLSMFDTPGYPDDVCVQGDVAYISDFYSIRVIDISDKNNPIEIHHISEYPYTISVFADGNHLYSSSEDEGIRVYDIAAPQSAEKISTLIDRTCHVGEYTVSWDGKNDSKYHVQSGVYFYKFKAGGCSEHKKMILLR